MKRWVPLFIAVAAVSVVLPRTTFAQSATAGISLQWANCFGGAGALTSKNFACNISTGAEVMYVSFVPPGGMTELVGFSCVIDVHTDQSALPPWWDITPIGGAGNCRATSTISGNFGFTGGPFDCMDPWSGQASGGTSSNFLQVNGDPTRVRINSVCAVALTSAIIPDSTQQYYGASVSVNHSKTTGAGLCAGCNFGACIRLNDVRLSQTLAGGGDLYFTSTSPTLPGSVQQIFWNTDPAAPTCTFTPTRKETWGQIKSLYR